MFEGVEAKLKLMAEQNENQPEDAFETWKQIVLDLDKLGLVDQPSREYFRQLEKVMMNGLTKSKSAKKPQ